MTPVKFILRYTAIPLTAIVAVVIWAAVPSSSEIDARQYAALSNAYGNFPLRFRGEIAEAMRRGRISDWDYQSLVRESLANGVALDWPTTGTSDVATERRRLAALVQGDAKFSENRK
ncbi:hypothetical protein FAZ69_27870 [Trinickia terrae]|uniref:Uncharacterized protein n=1 Tax=Trinickia terrae TaxID=2571161 RepID=A0A4U1HNY1_9BURK|nr:hypothetical protein [Trinickia terrae]TKC81447.1 hypothetical protein FAZ69_27870 [Trinickia terrae]